MKYVESDAAVKAILDQQDFLAGFSFDITPYVRVADYEREEYIIANTWELTRVLYLVSGTAKLYRFHKNGRLSLIGFFTPPSVLGIPELFEKGKRPFPLIAQTRCSLIEINTQGCRELLLNDARFLQSGCSMALKQNVAQNVHYINLTAYPVRNNLAECLLQLQRDGIVTIKYTELSEYLVVSYRHLMYVIRELCGEGILQRISKGFRILDMARLRALAEEIGEESQREEKEPEEGPAGGNRRSHL